jgi:hypothetical protein
MAHLTTGRSCREFAAGRQFPVGHQFVAVQLDPRLHEAELLARQLAGQHVAFGDAQRGLEFRVAGVAGSFEESGLKDKARGYSA